MGCLEDVLSKTKSCINALCLYVLVPLPLVTISLSDAGVALSPYYKSE